MDHFDLGQVYELLDRYVILNFLVRVLTSHSSRGAEEFNCKLDNIDFELLGLSDVSVELLKSSPSLRNLKKCHDEIFRLAEEASTSIFGYMVQLSNDEKVVVKEYVDTMVADYLTKIGQCQDTYLNLVVQIDKSTKEDNSATTRALGKLAKSSFNELYQYNTICQNYSNVSSYLRGMIQNYTKR